MQRVRIGLTGLACVFLLVLLAAAFFGLTSNEQTTGPLAPPQATTPAADGNAVETPREPLAELGVAPGFGGDQATTNSAAPPSAKAPPAAPAAR
ncbi:hypothetical protein [Sphingomonas profundi]|uniref:hypothetical protein n=1 Tax=Alterirhizorhabdus profundi TaxID=2681549 RepID=UPI001E54E6EB|nr:hypothetical protein [Sphingomonas profundi]